jgi:hypothetical protein
MQLVKGYGQNIFVAKILLLPSYFSLALTKCSVNLWGVQTKSDHKMFFSLSSQHTNQGLNPQRSITVCGKLKIL